jgi:hypothetical protein
MVKLATDAIPGNLLRLTVSSSSSPETKRQIEPSRRKSGDGLECLELVVAVVESSDATNRPIMVHAAAILLNAPIDAESGNPSQCQTKHIETLATWESVSSPDSTISASAPIPIATNRQHQHHMQLEKHLHVKEHPSGLGHALPQDPRTTMLEVEFPLRYRLRLDNSSGNMPLES